MQLIGRSFEPIFKRKSGDKEIKNKPQQLLHKSRKSIYFVVFFYEINRLFPMILLTIYYYIAPISLCNK